MKWPIWSRSPEWAKILFPRVERVALGCLWHKSAHLAAVEGMRAQLRKHMASELRYQDDSETYWNNDTPN